MKIGILESYNFSQHALAKLESVGAVSVLGEGAVGSFLQDKDILFVRLKYYLGQELLSHAKSLQYVCSPTTGLNHIDLDEVKKRKVKVVSLKGEQEFLSGIRAAPEHTFGLVLSLLRRYKDCFLKKNNADWNRELFIGSEIYKNKVGIIGCGRMGKLLLQYFLSFGAEVVFYDSDTVISCPENVNKVSSIEELIQSVNIVILSASYSQENKGLINKECIDLMKDKYFVNISRGELVDEEYLIPRIEDNHFQGIALDVIEDETGNNRLDRFIPLVEGRNFILTPHVGGATLESLHKTEEFIVEKLLKEI